MHLHILGICGTFMGGIAVIARQAGHTVTGCDANVYPPMSTQLEAQGIRLIEGFGVEQLALEPDVWVIGNVVTRGKQPLMEEVLNRGLPYISGPQWLAENVLQEKWVLAAAGTHGKTTTASMLAWILEDCGLSPGYLIGGVPMNFGVSARLAGTSVPDSPFFVIEADEYDTAFFDKRSKFVHYHPRTVILNNLEYDHADIFPDLEAIETQFHHLVRTVPGNGLVVTNGREDSLERVLRRGCWTPVEHFGDAGGWRADNLAESAFDVLLGDSLQGRVEWSLQGEHNRMNALAAIAAARHAGVPARDACAALGRFENVKRRMELRGEIKGVKIFDDFAHHPTAIATTLAGLRAGVGGARILAVLEPRSNTMKLGVMKALLADSLQDADHVFCYSGGIDWDVSEALAPLAERASIHADLDELVAAIAAIARPSDQVLVMSNGGFGGIHERLLKRLAE
ncbi:MAG: UDP-N-acetylmuramate:L-alanyl-gamma-D-glutamyl-meso-diaminopimelate ligase [Pseudomonadota bacterium]|nr:UDP-N-acetylmuramate:L-alanyl-gamma-D-glutamyl-meso-diaminopimelate ligase [Pseudomonadota bacterium]MDP1905113.1 UDP-N-acetylmuramate:L-alanyl-gamma-D-glutamyl-meso-diaminopimelate ligase [Pseudomonadota bacterium]MDP2351969.1 UDP-N-acetylmuramate:L-alanyl-gamma-D-glutamyl-meso-diaminopimelate ligase [Pseudomonadota bacterium]